METNTKVRESVERRFRALDTKSVELKWKIKGITNTGGGGGDEDEQVPSGRNLADIDLMKEMNKRKAKENNIFMHGAPESQSQVPMERIECDRNAALKLLHTCGINCGHESVVFVSRLGKYLPGKVRLVVLPDRYTKDRIFMNVRILQNSEVMKQISVKLQQEAKKPDRLRTEQAQCCGATIETQSGDTKKTMGD